MCIELRRECDEQIPSLVAVACFLPGRAKDLSAPPRKVTNTLSEFFFLLPRCNLGCTNAPECRSMRKLLVLLQFNTLLTGYLFC